MTDALTIEQRSNNMSRIRGKDTSIELMLRRELFSRGYRYRKNVKGLPGTPDIVLSKFDTVILVNGCFWHRHGCNLSTMPKTNVEYWQKKFDTNTANDLKVVRALELLGWNVITVWECDIRRDVRLVADGIEDILTGRE